MSTSNNLHISIVQDKRRVKKKVFYPVKLRVFRSSPRKQKLFPLSIDLTEEEFIKSWKRKSINPNYKGIRDRLLQVLREAEEVAHSIQPFSFSQFEVKYFNNGASQPNVAQLFENKVSNCEKYDQISTASTYRLASKALKSYTENHLKRVYNGLYLQDISSAFLKDYEHYLSNHKKRSPSTIGIYMRNLRTIFNSAIEDGLIGLELYPFGKRRYVIPQSRKVKKSLTLEELRTLYIAETQTREQEIAKDFWLLSYLCNGINIKDLCLLRNRDIDQNTITFIRAKTRSSSKTNLHPITTCLGNKSLALLNKHKVHGRLPNELVFGILNQYDSAKEQRRKVQNFTRFINQHLKKLAASNNLPSGISTYWARHTFATLAIQSGTSMELIQESLGHSSLKTTQSYFKGFGGTEKENLSKLIEGSIG